ncbi:unnamed protein product [Rhizoctonia solani]|uniref:BTB domain-containing protein n=1 Tax=Rhizoctonia solani TaxID=456999 RepID=A0A8H3GJ89_9AGAM|nr:unnamed protein product [Rhizoctonia solani]
MNSTTKAASWNPFGGKPPEKTRIAPLSGTTQGQGYGVTLESTNNQHAINDTVQSANTTSTSSSLREACTVYDFTGANIKLQVNDAVFKMHESQISKFASLNRLIEDARCANPQSNFITIAIQGDDGLVSDFFNTFRLLSTHSIEEPIGPSTENLVSAARISSTYNHPALRSFCIGKLEELSLGPIERLQIARVLDLNPWKELALKELSEREGIISKEEALDLGFDAYFQVASAREMRFRHQGGILHPKVGVRTKSQTPGQGRSISSGYGELRSLLD